MTTLAIVGGVTLALLAAWFVGRREMLRLDAELAAMRLYEADFYPYVPEPEGLIVEVFDEVRNGPRR